MTSKQWLITNAPYIGELENMQEKDFKRLGGDSSKGEDEELRQATMLEF